MNKNIKFKLAAAIGFLASALTFVGCSNDDAATATSSGTSYKGPGSAWTLTENADGSITITETDSGLEVTASSEEAAGGTKKLTVTNSNNNAVSQGANAYYMKVPGVAAVLYPVGGASQPITMPAVGSCPAAGDKNIMVVDVNVDGNFADNEVAAASGTISDQKVALTEFYDRDGDTLTGEADVELAFTGCSNSVATLADNTTIYVTENAGVVKTSGGEYYTIIPLDDSLNVAGRTAVVTAATKNSGNVTLLMGKIVFDADVSSGTRATLTPFTADGSGNLSEDTSNNGVFDGYTSLGTSGFKLTSSTEGITVTCAANDNMGSGSDKLLAFCAGVDGSNTYTVMIAEQ